jgi:hypothetical protein
MEIWMKFVISNIEGVSCRNVIYFDLSPEELSSLLRGREDVAPELFEDIKGEFDRGANIMFVNPVVGGPVDGIMAHNFLGH